MKVFVFVCVEVSGGTSDPQAASALHCVAFHCVCTLLN